MTRWVNLNSYSLLLSLALIFSLTGPIEAQRPTFATKDTLVKVLEYSLEYSAAVQIEKTFDGDYIVSNCLIQGTNYIECHHPEDIMKVIDTLLDLYGHALINKKTTHDHTIYHIYSWGERELELPPVRTFEKNDNLLPQSKTEEAPKPTFTTNDNLSPPSGKKGGRPSSGAKGGRPVFATKDTLLKVLEYSLEYYAAVQIEKTFDGDYILSHCLIRETNYIECHHPEDIMKVIDTLLDLYSYALVKKKTTNERTTYYIYPWGN